MKLKDHPADMDVPHEIEIRLSNIDNEKMGIFGVYFLYLTFWSPIKMRNQTVNLELIFGVTMYIVSLSVLITVLI